LYNTLCYSFCFANYKSVIVKSETLNCFSAKQTDLVDYLAKLGCWPTKIRNNDYWYLSPLRDAKEPSFKVIRKMNEWYDHNLGKGGDIIEFGQLYHNCSVKELLQKFHVENFITLSFHQQFAGEKKNVSSDEGKIMITHGRVIADPELMQYLHDRGFPLVIANRFCGEDVFKRYDKKHTVIGSKNNSGGYELRDTYVKASSSPKVVTLIDNKSMEKLSVFEGFFNSLFFQSQLLANKNLFGDLPKKQGNFLALKSLSFFEKVWMLKQKYRCIHLFLGTDTKGHRNTKMALVASEKYNGKSLRYRQYKDLKEWLIKSR
jgi:hypothetical protein